MTMRVVELEPLLLEAPLALVEDEVFTAGGEGSGAMIVTEEATACMMVGSIEEETQRQQL